MIKPMCKAVTAGLALTLGLGAVVMPANAAAEPAATQADADAANSEALPAPSNYDKEDFYQEGATSAATNTFALGARTSLVSVSTDMKYFARYESSCNYDQGFSAGDGYNALGYYQFDRRYGLVDFMQMCLDYNPTTYRMFEPVVARAAEVKSGTIYNRQTKQLTELGQLVEDAWHAAYSANPQEFSALQDTWAYNQYYLPAEQYLASRGINIADRSDCVKGLCWGLSNLFGTSGWRKFVGGYSSGYDWDGVWSNGRMWPGAGLSDNMTDAEFVTTLCDYVVENVSVFYKAQPQYHNGWESRYRNEKRQCLSMLAAAGTSDNRPGDAVDDAVDNDASIPNEDADNQQGDADEPVSGDSDASTGDENADNGNDVDAGNDNAGDSTDEGAEPDSNGTDDNTGADQGDNNHDAPDSSDDDATGSDGADGSAPSAPEAGDSNSAAPDANADAEDTPVNNGEANNAAPEQGGNTDADADADEGGASTPSEKPEADTPSDTEDTTEDETNGSSESDDNSADDTSDEEAEKDDGAAEDENKQDNQQDNDTDNASGDKDPSDSTKDPADSENVDNKNPEPLATHTVTNNVTGGTKSAGQNNAGSQASDTADTGQNATGSSDNLPETSDPAAAIGYAATALASVGMALTVAARRLRQAHEE